MGWIASPPQTEKSLSATHPGSEWSREGKLSRKSQKASHPVAPQQQKSKGSPGVSPHFFQKEGPDPTQQGPDPCSCLLLLSGQTHICPGAGTLHGCQAIRLGKRESRALEGHLEHGKVSSLTLAGRKVNPRKASGAPIAPSQHQRRDTIWCISSHGGGKSENQAMGGSRRGAHPPFPKPAIRGILGLFLCPPVLSATSSPSGDLQLFPTVFSSGWCHIHPQVSRSE